MKYNLTEGSITKNLLRFAFPLMVGNLLQQLYNVADTLIVGRFLGADALAAVGSSYTLMVFLTSILLGLCMGSSAFFSIQFGKKDFEKLKNSFFLSFVMIGIFTIALNLLVFFNIDAIIRLLQIPPEITQMMKEYLLVIFAGIFATFLYNYFANLLRAVGNSFVPLIFLAVSAILNIILDLVFVLSFRWGVAGAAAATVISQFVSGIGIMIYYFFWFPRTADTQTPYALEFGSAQRDHGAVFPDLYPAVDHEFWNFDGAGTGKQFRNNSDGSVCGGS